MGFMFDTNVFNKILDEQLDLEQFPHYDYYITHIQYDEIRATRDPNRRNQLQKILKKVPSNKIPTESAIWDISRLDEAKFGDEELFNKMLKDLQELDKKRRKRKKLENQERDILIAETAIRNCFILVSDDENLRKVVKKYKGYAISLEQFLKGEW